MMTSVAEMAEPNYRRDLADGLTLRWSTPEDVERVADLYARVFRPKADAPLSPHMPIWTRDMFSGRHPHIGPGDFAVVEDTRTGALVASTCLLRYTVEYEGVSVPFGRPEVVATLPEYRRQGLIRAIFELIHARSDTRGDLMQGITGISYYYRQFGYEYAAGLSDEALTISFAAIPELKKDATEPYTLRAASVEDVPLLRRLYDRERADAVLSTVVSEDYWRWVLAGMNPEALERWRVHLIADASGRGVGYVTSMPGRWGPSIAVDLLATEQGTPLATVLPSLLRGVRALAETTRPIRPEIAKPADSIRFRISKSHPIFRSLGDVRGVEQRFPYAWYIRVPDLPAFIRHIAPALERRLAASAQSGYSGELTLNFYRGGLRLVFAQGRLATAEDWTVPLWGEWSAGFPPLVFLKLLCGYRSLDDLRDAYPDVSVEGDAGPVLEALFPQRPSLLIPLD
ncbi:MAG: GNAT family N-acetyltransferase [Ktedonobacterales bacterium]